MEKSIQKIINGYKAFRAKYALGDNSVMKSLSDKGQSPEIMIVSCCDSRVDPALILQCDPGDLFIVRNVANIIPPYESDEAHHGTSAALEFGICSLNIKNLVILGHTQCGGIHAAFNPEALDKKSFTFRWVSLIKQNPTHYQTVDELAKQSLMSSYQNCLTFPWIFERIQKKELLVHLWFFDIQHGEMLRYSFENNQYEKLDKEIVNVSS